MGRGKGPKSARGIIRLLKSLGAEVRPTSERGRRQLVLYRGLGELAQAAKEGRAPRLTPAQGREVAHERRRLQRADEWRPRTKGAPRIQRVISDWFRKEDRLSRTSRAIEKGDIADKAKRSILDAIRRERQVRIVWIPNTPGGMFKVFNGPDGGLANFRRFARRPFYKAAFEKEMGAGRFVVAEWNENQDRAKALGRVIRELEV